MNNIESRPDNHERTAKWGFLEDMASVGRLDMVMGDVGEKEEEQLPVPEDTPQEEKLD